MVRKAKNTKKDKVQPMFLQIPEYSSSFFIKNPEAKGYGYR